MKKKNRKKFITELFYAIRWLSCATFGVLSMLTVMILTSIVSVNSASGWKYVIFLIVFAISSGMISRVSYNSHFIVRHLVAIWMCIITELNVLFGIGGKISKGMVNIRLVECKNTIDFYKFVLKIYDAYYEEVK